MLCAPKEIEMGLCLFHSLSKADSSVGSKGGGRRDWGPRTSHKCLHWRTGSAASGEKALVEQKTLIGRRAVSEEVVGASRGLDLRSSCNSTGGHRRVWNPSDWLQPLGV